MVDSMASARGEVGAVGPGRIHNNDSFKSATWRTLMEVGG